MPLNGKKTALTVVLAVFLLLTDRFLKYLAYQFDFSSKLAGDYLAFSFAPNFQIAFSLPLSGRYLSVLILVLCLAVSFYTLHLWQAKKSKYALCLFFLLLGAWSNLYDRLVYGFVIDYIYLKYFTVFNIADAMISLSALVFLFLGYREEKNA